MSTSRKNPKTASTSTGRLEKDLRNAENLLNAWARDPAEVFVHYGIASNKRDVRVKDVPGAGWCACGCLQGIEFEYETSEYAPVTFETLG